MYRIGQRPSRLRRGKRALRGLLLILVVVISSTTTAVAVAQAQGAPNWVSSNLKKTLKKDDSANRNGVAIRAGNQSKNKSTTAAATKAQSSTAAQLDMTNQTCSTKGATMQLDKATLPQLKKLREYEAVCGGSVTSTMMTFAAMPSTPADAISQSNWVATSLKQFAQYGVRPVIIFEPTTDKGPINFRDYRDGKYDAAMDTYFQNLKKQGVTDSMMGIWVPFPEPNIPEWDDTTIDDLTVNITKTVTVQKKYFPGSKASILLDSMSYPSGSHSWNNGSYSSLVPYVTNIPKGLIDSFGYQGFPWSPPQNEGGIAQANFSATKFLQAGLAIDAAKALGVNEVWVNTGSFARSQTTKANQQVTVGPETRSEILQSALVQAKKIQGAGFKVSVHLFAEDKASLAEGNDWSYWAQGKSDASSSTPVLKAFVANVRASNMDFWLFDVTH